MVKSYQQVLHVAGILWLMSGTTKETPVQVTGGSPWTMSFTHV